MSTLKTILVAGARPNFVKIAPIVRAMAISGDFTPVLVHTGQHYDEEMSALFFKDLGLPPPDINLGAGLSPQAHQSTRIMMRFESVVADTEPDLIVVVGDVTSTLATALTAARMDVAVAHVEAGLRSFDRSMPEEVNRVFTDALSELLFTTERRANENLEQEKISQEKVHFVGNVMIDTLLTHLDDARRSDVCTRLGIPPGGYALLTLHRPANVDEPATLERILTAVREVQQDLPVVFPTHPRTLKGLASPEVQRILAGAPRLRRIDPLGYLDFLKLLSEARFVLTDSGGIQEETTVLGVPCLTLRDTTERPVTVEEGTNTVVGRDAGRIVAESRAILAGKGKRGTIPENWDGHAAERIVAVLESSAPRLRGCRKRKVKFTS